MSRFEAGESRPGAKVLRAINGLPCEGNFCPYLFCCLSAYTEQLTFVILHVTMCYAYITPHLPTQATICSKRVTTALVTRVSHLIITTRMFDIRDSVRRQFTLESFILGTPRCSHPIQAAPAHNQAGPCVHITNSSPSDAR